jgi:hypothetical protein
MLLMPSPNLDEQKLVVDAEYLLLERLVDEVWVVDLDAQDHKISFDHVKQYD